MPRRRNKGIPKAKDFSPPPPKGLLVTAELDEALAECKKEVEQISRTCRAANRKFRDSEFDLENDPELCLFGLVVVPHKRPDVRRVSQIFDNPRFFANRPSSSDIKQGNLGDCWFLSALATMSTSPGLIEKLCVARDEEVGVYGFIFFRDNRWETVIIDDQLFWSIPKFEELNSSEQQLYHYEKDTYNSIARKGGKGLYFARSGTTGETWVPLIEKAYAKLHGDFAALNGGLMSEAIEDLTGGVSVIFKTGDILDPNNFWNEILLRANDNTHLFGVGFNSLDDERSGNDSATVQGLFGAHAYSILRVKECHGKRFIVLRNPWGASEWTGRWSDGSKEWTGEWLQVLAELDHEMGDDGEFVMEYSDFLETWETIERTTIFDASWVMSSHWLRVPPKPLVHALGYGEAVFYFTLPKASPAIIVLSLLDDRYFKGLEGNVVHNIQFSVYKRGSRAWKGASVSAEFWHRSVSCELELDAGDYVVYPRIDRSEDEELEQFDENAKNWSKHKLSRVLTQRTKSRSIAANYDHGPTGKFIPLSLSRIVDYDLQEKENDDGDDIKLTSTTTLTTEAQTNVGESGIMNTTTITTTIVAVKEEEAEDPPKEDNGEDKEAGKEKPDTDAEDGNGNTPGPGYMFYPFSGMGMAGPGEPYKKPSITGEDEDENPVFLGLKVYTKKEAVVIVSGRVRSELEKEDEKGGQVEGGGREEEDDDE